MKRLDDLEKRAAARQNGKVTVRFVDGGERKILLPDTIPLLVDENSIVEIVGDGGRGSGQLASLIRGIIVEPPEMVVEF